MNRVTRLISGSVNSIVDVVENASPETVMKEAIREIDRAIDDVRDQLGLAIANRHNATKRLAEANTKHEELGERLQEAVAARRDDLATVAISRQLDLEAQMPVLEEAVRACTANATEYEGQISALRGRRHEMEQDLTSYLSSRPNTPEGGKSGSATDSGRKVENAESAFNRALSGATGLPGTPGTDAQTAAKLAELEKLSRENRVQERLAAVKAKAASGE
jgi:phage shock protein A